MENNRVIFSKSLTSLPEDIIDMAARIVGECNMGEITSIEIVSESKNGYTLAATNENGERFYMVVDRYGVSFIARNDIDGEVIWWVK